jgi:HNH endonuclease
MTNAAGGTVLDVGRKTRSIPPAIRRALEARDRKCRFPGCTSRWCDAHHVVHWADGGPTRLENLMLLCRRHHRAIHEGGFAAWPAADGGFAFFRSDGTPIQEAPSVPPPSAGFPAGLAVTSIAVWDGTPLDLAWAIDVLRPQRDVLGLGEHDDDGCGSCGNRAERPDVLDAASRAASAAHPDPRTACFYARRALELAVPWNQAVHGARPMQAADAVVAVSELFHGGYWLARSYARQSPPEPGLTFDPFSVRETPGHFRLLRRAAGRLTATPKDELDRTRSSASTARRPSGRSPGSKRAGR